jgi:hypothetical protein
MKASVGPLHHRVVTSWKVPFETRYIVQLENQF